MKKILICGAGGTPTTNFLRSLQEAPEDFEYIGICSSKYDLCKTKNDYNKVFLVPLAKDPTYMEVLKSIIKETKPDFIHAQNDFEVQIISKYRDEIEKFMLDNGLNSINEIRGVVHS